MKKPVIASVKGYALANGAGLTFACDLTVAAEDAKFGTTAINVGLICLGPQNYFLVDWFEVKRIVRQQKKRSMKKPTVESLEFDSYHDLAESPLLFRNNVQMKPDGKHREVIIPSVPFRYNRFYDWPPDPSSTSIKEGSYSSIENNLNISALQHRQNARRGGRTGRRRSSQS